MISIIIPVYNSEKYLRKCLDGCLAQTCQEIEIIAIDDGSTDNSGEILDEYMRRESRIKVIHQTNQGVAAARNTGIQNAQGEYLIHLDSDDYCEKEMIEELYDCAIKNNADIVICDYFVNYPNKQIYISQQAPTNGMACMAALMNGSLHGSTCNKLIKSKLYKENHICFAEKIDMWEDLSAVIRLCFFAKTVVYLPKAYLHYNQLNNQSYTNKLTVNSLDNMQQAVKITADFLEEKQLLPTFENELTFMKLTVKRESLLHTRGQQQKEYAKLYPETDAYIFCNKHNPVYYKYAQWLIAKKQFWLANIIFNIIQLSRYLKRR